jgi:hypothetical protein
MRLFISSALFALILLCSGTAFADGRAFPPDGCSSNAPFMSFSGSDGSNTYCSDGQVVFKNAIPDCLANQSVVFDGSKFICKTDVSVPTCTPGQFLSFNGTNYECKSSGVATCADNQVLTFNGSSYYCVNRTDKIPNCGKDEFLTYNGSYQCAKVNTPSVPNCPTGYVLTGNGSALSCVVTAPTALAVGSINTSSSDANSGMTKKTDTIYLAQSGLLTASGRSWASTQTNGGNCGLRYTIEVDGVLCSMNGDLNPSCGGNYFTTGSCTKLLAAGSHTITSDTQNGNWDGYGNPWSMVPDSIGATLDYVVVPMNAP